MQHAERRLPGADRPECAPDRDNLATILSMAMYVHDALTGASAERVAARQATLRDCIEASKRAGMLYPIVDPAIEDMISAVEAVAHQRADARFDAAISACVAGAADALRLPNEPPESVLAVIMREGEMAADRARGLYGALIGALVKGR